MALVLLPYVVPTLYPVTAELSSIRIAGQPLAAHLAAALAELAAVRDVVVRADFLPSPDLVAFLRSEPSGALVQDPADGAELLTLAAAGGGPAAVRTIAPDAASRRVCYPWDLLSLNEKWVGALDADRIEGTVREHVVIDGHVQLGAGSVILPGVYIEGNVVIGRDCKIGPNCYIRGQTAIGDACHVGQAVEIKNSLLFDRVSIGHLSYVGDSVICARVNFGAGTIVSNLRHDGKNHRFRVQGELIDTGRRKFGAVIGEDVHTGIHSAIYPGRMLAPHCDTRPGAVIDK